MANMNINIINPTINLISQISTTSNSCENKTRFKIQTTNQAQITVAININKYTETETDRKFNFIQNGIITKSTTVNHSAYPTYFPNTSNDTFEIVEITLTGNIAEVEFFLENSGVANNFRAANVLVKDHTNGEDDTRQFLRFNDSSVCSKTGWRPIDPYCKQMNGENTGFKAWNTLEEYNLKTGVATGNTKPNTKNDNDYKSEVYDTTECPLGSVITENTRIVILFDNSGSMGETLPHLQDMREGKLEDELLGFYGTKTKYDEMVTIQNFDDIMENYGERTFKQMSLYNNAEKTIYLLFQDEASPSYHENDNFFDVNQPLTDGTTENPGSFKPDMDELNNLLDNGNYNIESVIFQISGFTGFRDFLQAIENGQGNYVGEYSIQNRDNIKVVYDVENNENETITNYYSNLVITALNNLGYNI